MNRLRNRLGSLIALACLACGLSACSSPDGNAYRVRDVKPRAVVRDGVAVTLGDQRLSVFKNGKVVRTYSVSTSKFGIGSRNGSNRTPLGVHAVTNKVGAGQPVGMVFKRCKPTGEVVDVNEAGRDPVVTRVIQLAGLENFNGNTHGRRIYIHGTPEERKIGRPASYGCIRMRSSDVIDLFNRVERGTPVAIESCSLATYLKAEQDGNVSSIRIPERIVSALPEGTGFKPARKYSRKSYSKRRTAKRSKSSSSSKRRVASTRRR
ncbi:MAG TPA: L,D-transpeptidase [Candidatus Akkermansia intestinigallinarum]|uniref:L,D-transpeptidase n=1 Tax=Candidatus Akkermansia intestinigallinarum TaxID=2838431 RepID=A0A9D1VCI5_9BACT|nr:L,D-transpeptidase [Candidatus Akkermansia intestinigallinarum]